MNCFMNNDNDDLHAEKNKNPRLKGLVLDVFLHQPFCDGNDIAYIDVLISNIVYR